MVLSSQVCFICTMKHVIQYLYIGMCKETLFYRFESHKAPFIPVTFYLVLCRYIGTVLNPADGWRDAVAN